MWQNFFQHIDIEPGNVNILDGNAADLQQECEAYERKIVAAGGVDLFIGGEGSPESQDYYYLWLVPLNFY